MTNSVFTAFQAPSRSHTITCFLRTEWRDIITNLTHLDQGRKPTLSFIFNTLSKIQSSQPGENKVPPAPTSPPQPGGRQENRQLVTGAVTSHRTGRCSKHRAIFLDISREEKDVSGAGSSTHSRNTYLCVSSIPPPTHFLCHFRSA